MKLISRIILKMIVISAALCLTACSVNVVPGESPKRELSPVSPAPPPTTESPGAKAETSLPSGNKTETPAPAPSRQKPLYEAGYYNAAANGDGITVTRCDDTGAGLFVFELTGHKDAEGYYPYHADRLTVTDAITGALVSIFDVNTTCKLPELGLTIADLNFDGAKDIMLYADVGGAHENIYYNAFLWDSQKAAFVQNDSFSEICNATVDENRQVILEIGADSAFEMWYAIYRYQGGAFVKEAGLTERQESNNDIPCLDYTEYRYPNGVETVIETNTYMVEPGPDATVINKYTEPGSYWDLMNPVWTSGDHYAEGYLGTPDESLSGYEREVTDLAEKALALLKNKDWSGLSAMVHPEQGLTFSPYGFVNTDTAVCFSASEVKTLGGDKKKRVWGEYDGSGKPIELTFAEYYDRFIFSHDFTKAPETAVDRIIHSTFGNNLYVFGNGAAFAEFHVPGTGADADYNWASLRLVFGAYDGKLYLVAVVHDEWTI